MIDTSGEFWNGGGPDEGRVGAWAALLLGGLWFPGQAAIDSPGVIPVYIDDGDIGYRIDRQRVKGKGGHKLVVEGYLPTPFKARCRISTVEQWRAYKSYFPVINPRLKENQLKAYPAQHPVLTLYGLTSLFVVRASFPHDAEGRFVRDVILTLEDTTGIKGSGSGKEVKATDAATAVPKRVADARVFADQPSGTVSMEPRRP